MSTRIPGDPLVVYTNAPDAYDYGYCTRERAVASWLGSKYSPAVVLDRVIIDDDNTTDYIDNYQCNRYRSGMYIVVVEGEDPDALTVAIPYVQVALSMAEIQEVADAEGWETDGNGHVTTAAERQVFHGQHHRCGNDCPEHPLTLQQRRWLRQ